MLSHLPPFPSMQSYPPYPFFIAFLPVPLEKINIIAHLKLQFCTLVSHFYTSSPYGCHLFLFCDCVGSIKIFVFSMIVTQKQTFVTRLSSSKYDDFVKNSCFVNQKFEISVRFSTPFFEKRYKPCSQAACV